MGFKPYFEHGGVTIYHGDCREILPTLSVCDVLLADPPYGFGFSDNPLRFKSKIGKWWSERDRSRVTAHDSVFGDQEPFDPSHLLNVHSRAKILWGANYYSSLLPTSGGWWVWDKRAGRRDVTAADWPLSEGDLAWTTIGLGVRVFRLTWFGLIRDEEGESFFHPTQKPISLMRWCLEKSKAKDVIDPYCGSGPTLVAAKQLGIPAVGIEINEKHCETSAKRLSQEVFDFGEVR